MKDEHIISLVESKPFAGLAESERAEISSHAAACESCRRAFEAVDVSSLLLKARVNEEFEPSPFFQTRVLALLRERQAANEKWAWSRLWRTAGGLATSMVATVATLAVLTFVIPGAQAPDSPNSAAVVNAYSTDAVVLDAATPRDDQISDSDVLATLYDADNEVVK
jgi:anti-sigma-K factor RskA